MASLPAVGLLALLAATAVEASRRLDLARDELICAAGHTVCIRGSLTYDSNSRVLALRGRLQSASGPGLFRITVRGSNRLGHVRFAPMEIRLRGNRTEIVDFRMIPDHPDVANWQIDRVEFIAASARE
ncbi:MAG: hypothetical protein QY320_12085 [Gammaproteobacteria bacterium]|nr:MAG: hypothetical protein QY320_12085 [Gammaproteobacteria bacterium]